MSRRCLASLQAAVIGSCLLFNVLEAKDVSASLAADGQVHVLSEANFASSLQQYPYTFVEFYAPWCGHCKKLEPEWEATAGMAQAHGIPVAKVDAIAEDSLASTLNVQSFPTLLLFRGDSSVHVKYNGPRDASSMSAWLAKFAGRKELAASPDPTDEAVKAWGSKFKVKVLGLLSGEAAADKGVSSLLEAVSFMLNPQGPDSQVPVGAASLPAGEIAKLGLSGVSLPTIVLLRDFEFEENAVAYEDSGNDLKAFMTWIGEKKTPALIPASRETEPLFLSDIQPGNALAVLFGSNRDHIQEVHRLAVEMAPHSRNLKWIHADKDDFGTSLAKNVGLEASAFPEFVVWQFGETEDDDRVWKLSEHGSESSFPEQDLAHSARSLVERWQSGALSGKTASTSTATTPPPPAKTTPPPASDEKKEVPCPVDADIFACSRWCDEISAGGEKLVGTLGGKPCAEWSPDDKLHDTTTCTCYDAAFSEAKLSCKPECVSAKSKAAKLPQGNDDGVSTCAAGDPSCGSSDDDDIVADF